MCFAAHRIFAAPLLPPPRKKQICKWCCGISQIQHANIIIYGQINVFSNHLFNRIT